MNKYYSKKEYWVSILVTLLPIIYGIIEYRALPPRVAIHFGFNGEPDNFASKSLVLFGFPIFMALFQAFLLFITNFSTKNQPVPKKMARLTIWIIPVINLVIYAATIQYSLNNATDIRRIVVALIGLIFVIMGNYLPTIPSNSASVFHLGFKNITFEAKDKYLQRYLGYIFVASGLLMLVTLILGPTASLIVTASSIGVIALYSFFVFFKIK